MKAIDARGYATTLDFSDRFGSPDGEARANSGSAELNAAGKYSYAFASSVTNAAGHTAYAQFDYYLGQPVDGEDANGVVSSGFFNDVLDRPTQVVRANNQGEYIKSQTSFAYDEVNHVITTTSDQNALGDNVLKSQMIYDGLGRTIEKRQYESPTAYITVLQSYDGLGRSSQTSNPFRAGESILWTTTGYDALSRVIAVTAPDSAAVTTAYSGNRVLVADQAGKKRISLTDGLGRLKDVWEVTAADLATEPISFPGHAEVTAGYRASYQYDALDNLTQVTQSTQQARTFEYDSLKRLTSATNPESGTVCYGAVVSEQCQGNGYDANGNLTKKTDARNVVTDYVYDALNRNTSVTYSDGTPSVYRYYDGSVNGIGRLTWMDTSGVSASVFDIYDRLGRPVQYRQQFWVNGAWGDHFFVSASYNKADQVKTMTYPSGRSVSYNYDVAGRLADMDAQNLAFTGNLGDGTQRTYAKGLSYSSFGGMTQEQFGMTTPIYNKRRYNVRGQLYDVRASTLSLAADEFDWNRGCLAFYYGGSGLWGQSSTTNNGNVTMQQHFVPSGTSGNYKYTQDSYTYDALNRLSSVSELHGTQASQSSLDYQQVYNYDRWGNRTIDQVNTWGAGIPKPNFGVDANTNRLTAPAGYSMSYDQAGNLTTDTFTGQGTRAYDADNRMKQAWANNQWQTYTYDGDGQRIKRNVNGVETWQVYGLGGELLAEYAANAAPATPQKEYGYRNGELLVTAEAASAEAHINHALATNGTTVTASSTLSGTAASHVIDGSRRAINGTIWLDNTFQGWPDWVEVSFNGSKTISQIDVVTQQDDYQNPVEPTLAQTFSLYGITAFDVQYWNGSSWVTVPSGSVTGNNKVWRQFTFSPITTSKIRVVVNAGADNAYSRLVEIEAYEATSHPNLALPANGGSVAVSSQMSPYVASYLTDGDRTGNGARVWLDNTYQSWPDWAEVSLSGSQAVAEVVVVTRQDTDPGMEPTEATTFSQYGMTSFEVQYWTGSAWATAPGGNITGNHQVLRRISFPAVTTTKIRVVVNAGQDNAYSRLVEIEVYGAASIGSSANVRWLVTDHLGTPRIILDQTGSLANISRHDYLPFGEEVPANFRTGIPGYATGDNVRQKFTAYERDAESGLDYAQARYYANLQGRFISVDPLIVSGITANPKTWNRYAYGLNNPMRFTDPTGLASQDTPKLPPTTGGVIVQNPCQIGTAGCGPVEMGTVTVTSPPPTPLETTMSGIGAPLLEQTPAALVPLMDPVGNPQAGHDPIHFSTISASYGYFSLDVSEDLAGNWYVAPGLGFSLGPLVTASVTTGTVYDSSGQPVTTDQQVYEGLTGHSGVGGIGGIGNVNLNTCCAFGPTIPNGGFTRSTGLGVPSVSVGRQHTFAVGDITDFILNLPVTFRDRMSPGSPPGY